MKLLRVVVSAFVLSGLAAPAFATPITYEFTVSATSGPLNGQTSTGQFTFDSSIIVPGGNRQATGLLTDLDFVWNAIAYTEATANTGRLDWDATGTLTAAFFGTDCGAGVCSLFPDANDWHVSTSPFGAEFGYIVPGASLPFYGNRVTVGLAPIAPAAVPEPASLLLLGTGVAGAVAARRRKKQSS